MKSLPLLIICIFAVTLARSQEVIKAIEVRDTTIAFGGTSYRIYKIDPYVVYQSQYHSEGSSLRPKFDSSTNDTTFEQTMLWSEMRDRFFVFHKDSSFGYQYDPHDSNSNNRRLPVDTAMNGIKARNNYEKLLSKTPDSSRWNETKTELREVYIGDSTKAQPRVRIVFYYSKALNHLKESMNPVVDSAKGMKLYKLEIFSDEFYSEADKTLVPPMKLLSTEMMEIDVDNIEMVRGYINKYRKTIGK